MDTPKRCAEAAVAAGTARGRLVLQCQQARTPWQLVVGAGGGWGFALVEELEVAGIDGHGLVGVAADEVAVADVVGPGGSAVGLARERVAFAAGLRSPRAWTFTGWTRGILIIAVVMALGGVVSAVFIRNPAAASDESACLPAPAGTVRRSAPLGVKPRGSER
ncbi:hypothetical protein GCM10029978_059490 [Actinoallomurus acanthiterrae]